MMQELGMAADYSLQLCLGPIDPPAPSTASTDKNILIGSSKSREDENPNPDNLLLPHHLRHFHAALLHQSPAMTMSYAGSSFNGVLSSYGDNVGCDQETNHRWISASATPAVVNPNFVIPSSALLFNSVHIEASPNLNSPSKATEISSFPIKTSTGLNNSALTAFENPADSALIAYANSKVDIESSSNENAAITASRNPKDVSSKDSISPDHFSMKDSSNDNSFITIISANANPSCAASENHNCTAKVKICAKPIPTSTSSENHNSFGKVTSANPNASTAINASATTSSSPSNFAVKSVKFEISGNNTSVTRVSSHSSSCFPSGSAMAEDRSSRLGPVWIAPFVNCQSYFSKCQVHVNQSEENRLEKNQFCIDCVGGPICPRGLKRDHDGHRTLQVRRASKSNAIKATDIQEHVDITGIQQYTINNAKIVFLCKRPSSTASLSKDTQAPHSHSHSHSQDHSQDHPRQRSFQDYIISSPNSKACHAPKASFDQASKASCLACGRTLPDSMKFCSLQCKLESIAKNIDDQHVRYNTTSNRVSSLSSLSLSLQPSSANPISSSSSAAAFDYDSYGASSSSNSNHFQSNHPKEISCAAGSIDDMKPALFPLRKRRPSSCPPPPRYIKNSSSINHISGSACKLNCHFQKLRASAAAVHSQVKSISPDKEEGDEEDVDGNVMVRSSTSYSAEPAMGANHAVGRRRKKKINTVRSLEAQVISGRCSNPQHDLSSSNLLMQASVGVPRSDCELPMESRARLRKSTARPVTVSSSSDAQEMRMMINASSVAEISIKAEECKDCVYSNKHSSSPPAISISIKAASTDDLHHHDFRTGSNSTGYIPAIPSQYSNYIHHHLKKRLHKRKGFPRRSPFQ